MASAAVGRRGRVRASHRPGYRPARFRYLRRQNGVNRRGLPRTGRREDKEHKVRLELKRGFQPGRAEKLGQPKLRAASKTGITSVIIHLQSI